MHTRKLLRPRYIFLAALLFTVLATIAFLMPGSSIPSIRIQTFVGVDKLLHAGIHFVLVLGWLIYYARHYSEVKMRNVFYISLSCVLYGIIIELLQWMTETRGAELADVFANMTGTGLGILVFLMIKSKIKMKA